jgi:rare lipoprotein A
MVERSAPHVAHAIAAAAAKYNSNTSQRQIIEFVAPELSRPSMGEAGTNVARSMFFTTTCAEGGESMRSYVSIVGLAVACLAAPADSRGFGWFFAHSKPMGSCAGQHVVATYYVAGRRTASGQAFNPGGLTAAHRTLPFGSQVTVMNPQTGASVAVVINDRGPFTRGVTLDLSRGAARAIGMRGTQWVCML